jgi:insulysin
MFDISNEGLEGALDRFASVFTAPLFDESCVEREMKAVNSENDNYINRDNWRFQHL